MTRIIPVGEMLPCPYCSALAGAHTPICPTLPMLRPVVAVKVIPPAGQLSTTVLQAIALARQEEREACIADLQALLDGDFCGSDVEALQAGIAAIRARGESSK